MYIVHWGRRLLPTDMKLHFNYLYIFCSAVLIFTIHHAESDALEPQNSVFKAFFFLQQSSRRRPEPLVPEGVWTFHITFPGGRNWRFLLNKNMLSKALKTTKPRLQQVTTRVEAYSFGLFTMTKHWIIQSRCQSLFQRSFQNIFQMLKPWSPQIEPSPIPERQVNGLLEHSDSAKWFAKTASNKQSAVLQLDCKIVQIGAGRISLKFNQLRVKSELIAESNPEQLSLAQSSQVSWSAREWEMVNSEILHRERG